MISLVEFDEIQAIAKRDEGMAEMLEKLEVYYQLKKTKPAQEEVNDHWLKGKPSKYATDITSYYMDDTGQWIQRR